MPARRKSPAHRFAADRDALYLRQLLCEVAVIEAGVLPPRQFLDPIPERQRQGPGTRPASIAVPHPVHGFGPIAGLQPLHLPPANAQQSRGLLDVHPPHHGILGHFQSL